MALSDLWMLSASSRLMLSAAPASTRSEQDCLSISAWHRDGSLPSLNLTKPDSLNNMELGLDCGLRLVYMAAGSASAPATCFLISVEVSCWPLVLRAMLELLVDWVLVVARGIMG